jgi:hypothetical protein
MNQSFKVPRSRAIGIIQATFPAYAGRKISVEFTRSVTFTDTNWSGGTKTDYVLVRADGMRLKLNAPAPWVNPVEGATFTLPVDVLVVTHSYFCGHDMGLTIYAHPSNAPKWLEAGKA